MFVQLKPMEGIMVTAKRAKVVKLRADDSAIAAKLGAVALSCDPLLQSRNEMLKALLENGVHPFVTGAVACHLEDVSEHIAALTRRLAAVEYGAVRAAKQG
jgi:hypothetical protein